MRMRMMSLLLVLMAAMVPLTASASATATACNPDQCTTCTGAQSDEPQAPQNVIEYGA